MIHPDLKNMGEPRLKRFLVGLAAAATVALPATASAHIVKPGLVQKPSTVIRPDPGRWPGEYGRPGY